MEFDFMFQYLFHLINLIIDGTCFSFLGKLQLKGFLVTAGLENTS